MRRARLCLALPALLAAPALEAAPPRPSRQYTIEQFMATTALRGASFSPDESKILFSSDETGIFNVYTVSVTPHEGQVSFSVEAFDPDARALYYTTNLGGEFARVKRYLVATGVHEEVEKAEWDVLYTSFSKHGRYRVTAVNILWKPHQASALFRAPALVWVHGGPGGQTRKGYGALIQYLVNHGYVVLGINNRGSSGYGQTFYTADDQKHGKEPLWDCVDAKKYLATMPYVDKDRIGIIGGSYGGYMVLAALAFQPDVFAAGVDIFGVYDPRVIKPESDDIVAFRGSPSVRRHLKSSLANATPVTDGRRVVVLFGVVGVLASFDYEGRELWRQNVGVLDCNDPQSGTAEWGHASSPVLWGDFVVVQGDELVTNGRTIRSYDPRDGRLLWTLGPNSEVVVATPVVDASTVYVTAGYPPVRPVYAVRAGHRGDLSLAEGVRSSAAVAWSHARGGTYIPTPLLYRGHLYTLNNNGILTCYRADSGEQAYQTRLGRGPSSFAASPVAADGRLYFASETGEVYVLAAGPEQELLATNTMDEVTMATPAISDGLMVLRTLGHVVGIGAEKERASN